MTKKPLLPVYLAIIEISYQKTLFPGDPRWLLSLH